MGVSSDYSPSFAPTRGEVITSAVKRFELPAKFGDSIAASWDMDRANGAGDTLAGLANAMTRASQELVIERASVIESAAGNLIKNGWGALTA